MEIICLAVQRALHIEGRHILAHRVSVDIGVIIHRGLSHHTRLVSFEWQGPVRVDRYAVTLHLPFARYDNLIPSGYVVILIMELHIPLLGTRIPSELPHSVQRHALSAGVSLRRQGQRCMIRFLVDPYDLRVFPIVDLLSLSYIAKGKDQ